MEYPPSYFNNITNNISSRNEDIDGNYLARLAFACDDKLMTSVLCPWRCSKYIHQCGYVTLDLRIQRHLQDYYLKIISSLDQYCKIYPSRDNYLRKDPSDYD